MAKPVELKMGDSCPACDGDFKAARVPTDEQRRLAAHRDNPTPLPPHYDTATEADRAELGDLYRCQSCGYVTRFKSEGAGGEGDGEGEGDAGQGDVPAPRSRAASGRSPRK